MLTRRKESTEGRAVMFVIFIPFSLNFIININRFLSCFVT